MFEAAGWHTITVKYGRWLRRAVRARRRRRRCASGSTRCRTRSTSGCCASDAGELRERLPGERPRPARASTQADRGPRRRRAAARDPRPRRPRPRRAARGVRRRRQRQRPPVGGVRLHDQGVAPGHPGPSRQPLGAAQRRAVGAARRRARRRPVRSVGDVRAGNAGSRAVPRRRPSGSTRPEVAATDPPPVPARARSRAHAAGRRPSRRSDGSSSTSRTAPPRSRRAW